MSVFMHEEAACSSFGMKSTASSPSSPQLSEGLSGHVELKRSVTGASTCLPSPDYDCFEQQVSEATEDDFNLPASQLEACQLHLGGFSSTSDPDVSDLTSGDDEDYYLDDDGAVWIEKAPRHDASLQSKEDYLWTKTVGVNYIEILEDKLAQVKCLYQARFGEDIGSEDTTYDSQLQKLQVSLCEVAALFQRKYGLHADNIDEDGCVRIKMAGSCCMETLEEKLAEVKCLYHEKFSKDAESENATYGSQLQRCQDSLYVLEALFAQKYGHGINDVGEDDCVWIKPAGRSRMETLEEKLAEVKSLSHEKFGADAESDDETYDSQLQWCQNLPSELEALFAQTYGRDICDVDEDGCVWINTTGRSRMETLEEKLAEVKCLYHTKFGTDAGPEDETYDSKLQGCQDSLCELEALFAQKYGHDIDDVGEDGCLWIKTAGSSCMGTLEMKLAEVKCMYHDKFGTDVDETYDSQLHRCQDSLCKLEALFAHKYGHDIDDVDEDGCVWINTVGCSSMDTLEVKLAEVKCLYHEKFGTAVDETYDSQLQRSQDSLCKLEALFAQKYGHAVDDLGEDGCVWVKTVVDDHMCGITELQPLQAALDTVKSLFRNKYGHDVDDEEIFRGCYGCSKPFEV